MRRSALVTLILVLGTACGGADASGGAQVRLDEFSVDVAGAIEAGSSELVVRNGGEFGHTLVIADDTGQVVAATDLIPAGAETVVSADLAAGRYQFSCRIVVQTPDGSISDHFEQGMVADVEVSPSE